MHFGPNGGLVFCMEFLLDNLAWLEEELGEDDDDYVIFDCPGQIELYTHLDVMRRLTDTLQGWNFRLCAVFLLDSHFMISGTSFISGTMACLSAMTSLEVPFVSVLSKIDLLSRDSKKQLERSLPSVLIHRNPNLTHDLNSRFLEPEARDLLASDPHHGGSKWAKKHRRLTEAIGEVLEGYGLVRFFPLNIKDEESLIDLLTMVDNCIQYGEDRDVKTLEFEQPDDEEQGDDDGYGGEGNS